LVSDAQYYICGKGTRNRPEDPEGSRGIALLFLDLGARKGGWSATRPGCFTPGKDLLPIVQEVGWAPGPVWTCAKNLAPAGIRSPDRNFAVGAVRQARALSPLLSSAATTNVMTKM
jgi:hypothetical protein